MEGSAPQLNGRTAVDVSARPFRFGLGPAGLSAGTASEWRDMARKFGDLGYQTICLGDHLDARPPRA